MNGPTNGGYRPPPSNFNAPIVRPFRDEVEDDLYDDMDDDEDECSTRNFDRVLVATTEMTGVAPNPACARAVFDKICDECEDDIQCYLKLGRQVGPQTPQCQPRRLRQPKHRKLMPYWKGAGFTSLGDCIARGPVGNCRQTWRGYKWVSCGGSYCRQRADMDDEVGAWGLAGKLIMHELSGGRPAYDEDDNVGNVFGNGQ